MEEKYVFDHKCFNRPAWPQMYMKIALLMADRSTCLRLQTGALLVRDQRIIATGYNGTVSGSEHCCDQWKKKFLEEQALSEEDKKAQGVNTYATFNDFLASDEFSARHHAWATKVKKTCYEVHGEQNAILYCGKTGGVTDGCDLYTVYSPCINCAKVCAAAGVRKVYYNQLYKRDNSGLEFLREHNIEVEQVVVTI